MQIIDKLKEKTRWDDIPDTEDGYRLLCSDPVCSLSCANLRNGKLSVTSVHGTERHSYLFTKTDMAFTAIMFLNELSDKELENFCNIFNRVSPDKVIVSKKI